MVIAAGMQYTSVITGGAQYNAQSPGPQVAQSCPGTSASLSAVFLQCPPTTWGTSVDRATRAGRPVIAVAIHFVAGGDVGGKLTRRIVLDAKSYLPVAVDEDDFTSNSQLTRYHYDVHSDFVAADSLARDFFTPASIGMQTTTVQLPDTIAGTPIYWLGQTSQPVANLPALTLVKVQSAGLPGYVAILNYQGGGGAAQVNIQVFPPAAWSRVGFTVARCPNQDVVSLDGGGTGVVYCGTNSPVGLATFPDTVLLIDTPGIANSSTTNPYANSEAIVNLLKALQRRTG
jgi:hypothetical protein